MSFVLSDCSIRDRGVSLISSFSWDSGTCNKWLVTGPSGSGKSVLVSALADMMEIVPSETGYYKKPEKMSIALVSFETAAALIEEERKRDDSDFTEGGIDDGRTPRKLILETLSPDETSRYPDGANIESHPAVLRCGISAILDRGLKYLSTGEIRRTLLCKALASNPNVLILDDPYDGLDAVSRESLTSFFDYGIRDIELILVMDRIESIPASITHVLELSDSKVSFCGLYADFDKLIKTRASEKKHTGIIHAENAENGRKQDLEKILSEAKKQRDNALPDLTQTAPEILVEMRDVVVEWSDRRILDRLSWTLRRGEHWLIRGPNGSGKTTLLELITGDNPQVFRNDIRLFGKKRGSGETIWELKEKMGVVSYRLHTEYRSLGDLTLEAVVLSGLHDSIGLYQQCGEEERALAEKWLHLAGFAGRSATPFRDLSYGEQRAVLIARASIKQPPILILDEPCHGLDDTQRIRVLEVLQAIAENGTSTMLHVTHDPAEVLPCEKHILELCPGEKPMYRIIEIRT